MMERRAMIERGVGFLSRFPGKVEAGLGLSGTLLYGATTAYPSGVQELAKGVPVYGRLVNVLSDEDLKRGAGALVIVFGIIAVDGFKKIISERNASDTSGNRTVA